MNNKFQEEPHQLPELLARLKASLEKFDELRGFL